MKTDLVLNQLLIITNFAPKETLFSMIYFSVSLMLKVGFKNESEKLKF